MNSDPATLVSFFLWLVVCCIPVVMGLHALGNWIERRNSRKQIEEEFKNWPSSRAEDDDIPDARIKL